LLTNLFSFLRRKTDFYSGASSTQQIEDLVLKVVREQGKIFANEEAEKKKKEEQQRKKKLAEEEKKRLLEEKKKAVRINCRFILFF
jgi:hypothetical protein